MFQEGNNIHNNHDNSYKLSPPKFHSHLRRIPRIAKSLELWWVLVFVEVVVVLWVLLA
jgi:hypothetical protein